MDNVLITGATGFIGSHVAERFCENGISIGCLVREESDISNIKGLSVKFEHGDITDLNSLTRAFKGYDFVIHIAGYARDWGDYEEFYNINVEGTLNVLRACLNNGIKNVIITSSISVYGEENCRYRKDESSPWKSHYNYFMDRFFPCKLNYYRDTKAIAKGKAIEFASENKINVTILEPVWVYGEREFNTGFYEYMKTAQSGIPFLPGSKSNRFHVVYARDLSSAYYLAYLNKLEGINDIIIGNREVDNMDKIYSLFCENSGINKPRKAPKFIFYPVGFIIELLYTIFRTEKVPLLTRGRVNMFYDNIEYSTRKAEKLLGFTNKYTIEEGIQRTVKWYKDQKLI